MARKRAVRADTIRRPVSHPEFAARFIELDNISAIRKIVFRGWLAWPLVKEHLWHNGFRYLNAVNSDSLGATGWITKAGGVIAGFWELTLNVLFPKKASLAVLYSPRNISDGKGGCIHPHLGKLIQQNQDVLECIYEWKDAAFMAPPRRGCLRANVCGAFLSAAGRIWRLHPEIRRESTRLADVISPHLEGIPADMIYNICRGDLAGFVVKQAAFHWLFRRAGVQRLVVLDPDAKCSEIAAAKSLGLPVIELQHGMFGLCEPEYAWTADYLEQKREMAVPDKVLVFGPLWRDALLTNGFWQEDQVINAGNALLCARQPLREKKLSTGRLISVLFPTQYYVRQNALKFWGDVLAHHAKMKKPILRLLINIHPGERQVAESYKVLSKDYPDNCEIISNAKDGIEAIVDADVVVGYTSFMLMEALGLHVPAISLCGGAAPDGMAGSFGFDALRSTMPHISEPQELLDYLQKQASVILDREKGCARAGSDDVFYTPQKDFDTHLLEVIETA